MLTLGQGDVGQLGLGESVLERKKPALVPLLQDVVQAEAGGMHTVCLSQSGQVGQRVGTGWIGPGCKGMKQNLAIESGSDLKKEATGPDFVLMGHPGHRSTPLAAMTRVPWEGTPQSRAQRWSPGKWNCKRKWCKCQRGTVTQQLSLKTAESSSGALFG